MPITVGGILTSDIKNIEAISKRNTNTVLNSPIINYIVRINTYAPHLGYGKGEMIKYWKEISEDAKTKNNKHCIIWRTDNSGGISNEVDARLKLKIGNWALVKMNRKLYKTKGFNNNTQLYC